MNAIRTITAAVAEIRGVALEDILSDRRSQRLVRPRHEAMYFAKALTPASLPAIGRRMGGRDHTTVLSGIRRVEDRIASEAGYGDEIEAMGAAIRQKLPATGRFELVPPEDVDVEGLAARVEAAIAAGEQMTIYADQVAALAAQVLRLEQRLSAVTAAAEQQRTELSEELTEYRDALAIAAASTEDSPAVRAVLSAHRQFESDRYSSRERFAQQQLDRALKALQTHFVAKDIAA